MLERPLTRLVPPAAAALYCAVCLDLAPGLHLSLFLLMAFLFAAGALVYQPRLFTICCMLAAAAFAFSGFDIYRAAVVEPVRELAGKHMEITAIVMQDPDVYEDSQRAELSVEQGTALEGSFRMLCYLPLTEEPLLAGDRIEVNVGFYVPGASEGFDRASYQASNGWYIAASYTEQDDGTPVSFSVLTREGDSLYWLPKRIARFCKQACLDLLPAREGGLLSGLLIGDTATLPDDDTLAFQISGLSHMVAVSGMHVAFLVGFCYLIFGRRIGNWVSMPLILFFVPIAGATPSVLRAALMYLLAAGAFVLRRETNGVNSLLAALAVLLLYNPYSIASLSLQLSFAATLGLLLLSSRMQRRMMRPFSSLPKPAKKLVSVAASAVACTASATIFTTPILLTSFGSVSILSLISNLLIVGVTGVTFIGGIVLCVAAAVFPPAAAVAAALLRPFLSYVLWVANFVADIPVGLIGWGDAFGVAALAVLFGAVLLWILAGDQVKWRAVLPCVCTLVLGITVIGSFYHGARYTVTYLPCGSGQAILVSDTNRHVTLIDCAGDGGYRNAADSVREWMRWNGCARIDTLILTAVDRGHARDLPVLLGSTEVDRILMPAGCEESKYNTDLLELVYASDAQEVDGVQTVLNGDVTLHVFPIASGKLGVQIADDVLVLHSPTQKQLAAYLEQTAAPPYAPEVVLSENQLEDADLLAQALDAVHARRLVVQAAFRDITDEYEGRPVESPYFSGEIVRQFVKE